MAMVRAGGMACAAESAWAAAAAGYSMASAAASAARRETLTAAGTAAGPKIAMAGETATGRTAPMAWARPPARAWPAGCPVAGRAGRRPAMALRRPGVVLGLTPPAWPAGRQLDPRGRQARQAGKAAAPR